MANIARISFKRLLNNNNVKYVIAGNGSIRTIISKNTIPEHLKVAKPKPWNYREKPYRFLNRFTDRTSKRFDENTAVIVVEGPVAAGKSKLAKEIAAEFDMLYYPEANLDMIYINSYGFDQRKLDPQLPINCKSFDVMDFLRDPKHINVARFQLEQYMVKFSQYIDALAHVFSTGQGVVLDRSCFSDFVFAEAMYKSGYLSKGAYKKYYEIRDNTIFELLKPHLVIYLDVPVPKIIENVNKRALSYEKNSPVLTPQYLQTMEHMYKQNYLKNINAHAELLVYDWSDEGDVEIIVEDIERIDFNKYDKDDSQLSDWRFEMEEDYAIARTYYADRKDYLMQSFNIPCHHVPELILEAEEGDYFREVLDSAPGNKYEQGYNSELGDSGYLFKSKMSHRDTLPMIERRK